MSGSTARPQRSRLRWIIPAIIAALLFLGGVAGNLVATDLDSVREQYPVWVWSFFFVVLAVTVFVAVREYNRQDKSPAQDERATGGSPPPVVRTAIVNGEVDGETLVVRIPSPVNALHQLPPPPRDFTGRVRELEELMSQIEIGGATISGLQGLGGIGKTTLALELARRLAPRYPDAQFYLDLKGAGKQPLSVAEALSHVIRAYHPTAKLPEGEAELKALYLSVLHGQRALLLMDNAEGREQVEPLIPPAGCVLLVTSRQHFTLPGLFALDLETLPPKDARQLLLKIAPRIGDSADEIAKLCGYLPLALRLAASALAERMDLTSADYVRRLSDAKKRLELVGASLTLSYELLDPEHQKRWRSLAVFSNTFDAAAAGAVWQLDADATQDVLGDLLRYSLLKWDEDNRRYSLHDLARLFANSHMSDDERHATSMRHAAYYLNVLQVSKDLYLKGGDAMKSGLARFDTERRNIEAGQVWACRHADKNKMAAQLCNNYPDAGGYVLFLRQHPRESISWLEAALVTARQLKERAFEGRYKSYLAIAHTQLGEMRQSIELCEQALLIARELGDRSDEGIALGNMGNAYINLGEPRRAAELYEQHLTLTREVGDRLSEGTALGNLGNAYADLGEPQRAIEFYEQALTISREVGDWRGEGRHLGTMGLAYADMGEPRRAIEFYEQQLKIVREIGDQRGEAIALNNLGFAYSDLGEPRRAVEFYEQALIISRGIGDWRVQGTALFNAGMVLNALGERAKATTHVDAALEIFERIESPHAEKVRAKLAEWRGEQ